MEFKYSANVLVLILFHVYLPNCIYTSYGLACINNIFNRRMYN